MAVKFRASEGDVLADVLGTLRLRSRLFCTSEFSAPWAMSLRRGGDAREGSGAVIARLTDIIFVQAVRVWLEERRPGEGGWLGALRDPQIGAALALIHRAPERPWSVATLAAEVGMSRSPFAARFKQL